ncbi:MAG: hypothetical protein ABW174_14580, partial [Flavitalea sp.]
GLIPEKIDFINEVSYALRVICTSGDTSYPEYPDRWYRKTEDSAIAVYGNYAEDLFRIKAKGILRIRNLFGNDEYKFETVEVESEDFNALNKNFRLATTFRL